MHAAYCATRMGLNFRVRSCDTGSIGGTGSHEFQVLAESGEDLIAFSDSSDYAANIEMAEALAPAGEPAATAALTKVATPAVHTIDDAAFGNVVSAIAKTLLVLAEEDEHGKQAVIALVLRGDHELNEIKAEKLSAWPTR
jgi:prolyl-tRNA synthetase